MNVELPEKTQENFQRVAKQVYDRLVAAWGVKRGGCMVVEINFSCGGTSVDRCKTYFVEVKERL